MSPPPTDGPADDADGRPRTHRPVGTIASQLAEVERHLQESPPHSSGDRQQLEVRRTALQRELAAARDRSRGR